MNALAMNLTEEQILSNWDTFINVIDKEISNPRGKILLRFYNENAERFSTMPASGKITFHNAFPGGYVAHVLNVYSNAKVLYDVWKQQGAFVDDFTYAELMFTALNHDLGKFGTEQGEYYVPQNSDWHRNKGELYQHNGDIPFMKTSDRSLFILQSLGVSLSENEYMAIKLHDGLYEESNKSYYVSYSDDYRLRPHLAYILHQADLMASRIEYDNVNRKNVTVIKMNYDQKLADPMETILTTATTAIGSGTTTILNNKPSKKPKNITGKYAHLLK